VALAAPARAVENVAGAVPDHLPGTTDELAGWAAATEQKWIKARELGEKIVHEHPDSFGGQYVLGVAMHYGEGDLARSVFHLEKAMRLFEQRHGAAPPVDTPWRWHEATLRELAFTLGEMDRPAEELVILDKYDVAYAPKRIAQRVWPLMKLRRYDDSRTMAKLAVASGDPQQRTIARSDLCAAECEAGDREMAYKACVDALTDFRRPGTGGQVEYSNASESALSIYKYDEAERFLLESTQRATPDSWGNPFQHLAQLYLTEARVPEGIAAVKGAQELRMRRPPWLDQHGEARLNGTIAELFLLVGVTDRAVSAAQRAVDRPDRQGVHSGTDTQADAAAAVRLATALHELAVREEEDAITSSIRDAMKLRTKASWHRLEAWRARRRAAVMLADEDFLVKSLRPYYVGGIDLTMWFMPDAVDAVGGGVALAALTKAREAEPFHGSEPYFDALEAEAHYERGDCEAARRVAEHALRTVPAAEALLRARLEVLAGECARRAGDETSSVDHLAAVLTKDPGLMRRLELRLPVVLETDGSDLADRAASLVEKSPRFRVGEGRFRVNIIGGQQPQACLLGPHGEQFNCARVNLPVDTDAKVGARLLVAEFHKAAFALKADLSQADLTSLDGSPTAGRADRQVKSLLDTIAH
jgi:tetratricopeptide (TPR) repeat protein